ncbi:hypothetical protein QQS21_002001 [Conoideocrella luteorostrata]|uniref:Uncharacterized protein n=1 Tax=Conoideocrella luteorostrata TaxID=1105319 RepID=A0AAJ0CW16_9HYPO|nr:hypothetical protein QQS21_002001 [Conoideocrella luteorostrata]
MVRFLIVVLAIATSCMALSASKNMPGHEHTISRDFSKRKEAQVGSTEDPADTKRKLIQEAREAAMQIEKMLAQMLGNTTNKPDAKG